MLSGCSLVLTSATPHRATATGPPTGCDSVVWPIGDFLLAPTAVVSGGLLLVGMNVEGGGSPATALIPAALVTTGIVALVSGFAGVSRIGRCSDLLPRAKPDSPSAPNKPIDPNDDSRPSWGE